MGGAGYATARASPVATPRQNADAWFRARASAADHDLRHLATQAGAGTWPKERHMSRIRFAVRRPRRVLAALATVLAATGLTVASGADFTARSANPSNTFTTGTLSVSNSRAGAAILSASGLKPGDAPVSG